MHSRHWDGRPKFLLGLCFIGSVVLFEHSHNIYKVKCEKLESAKTKDGFPWSPAQHRNTKSKNYTSLAKCVIVLNKNPPFFLPKNSKLQKIF